MHGGWSAVTAAREGLTQLIEALGRVVWNINAMELCMAGVWQLLFIPRSCYLLPRRGTGRYDLEQLLSLGRGPRAGM